MAPELKLLERAADVDPQVPPPTAIRDDFRQAVLAGLSQRRKSVPARFLYDELGSELFEAITTLPEYYPTRAEVEILQDRGDEIARHVPRDCVVVEFGSGSAVKTPLLLDPLSPSAYVPIDISPAFLRQSEARIRGRYPGLEVFPVPGDFEGPLALPATVRGRPAIGFFPGSTIGNLTPRAATDLLKSFAALLGPDAFLVIGIDLKKDRARLERAYDDGAGVTAAFNLNLIDRINRELDGDLPRQHFRHYAVWDERKGRVEMHLLATRDIWFTAARRCFHMASGETIHTENSYKYAIPEARLLARVSGWQPAAVWTDGAGLFGVHLWHQPLIQIEPRGRAQVFEAITR